jgi:hypothetical protein
MSRTRVSSFVRTGPRNALRRGLLLSAVTLLLAAAFTVSIGAAPDTAHAATVAINQCNFDETGAAREIRCDVTVVNNLDVATGITSSTVTTTVCAGPPGEALCVTTPGALTVDIVGSVNQCNNSVNAGGSIVTCNVNVVNNVTGVGSTSPATVNQCIGSGQGGGTEPTTNCAPVSSASGADIIQCNTAGNGGGASNRVQCTASGTVSSLWPVTIVQCNDSANGAGDLVTCTAQLTTNLIAVAATTTAAATTAPADTPTTAPGGGTTPVGGTIPRTGSQAETTVLLAAVALVLGAFATSVARRKPATHSNRS